MAMATDRHNLEDLLSFRRQLYNDFQCGAFGRTHFVGLALAILALTLLAGSISSGTGSSGSSGSSRGAGNSHFLRGQQERRYDLKGVVQSVDKAKKRATIKHEKVGDLMGAMTMPFLIKDEKALNEMEPGDRIKATLVTTSDGGQWLEKVTIIAKAKKEKTSNDGGAQIVFAVNSDPGRIHHQTASATLHSGSRNKSTP
jgi:Cu/Ag efflux protein CusF